MKAPDGSELLFVSFGEVAMPLAVGQALPNGYIVRAITPQAIEFDYPPLNATARLELPRAPFHEIR